VGAAVPYSDALWTGDGRRQVTLVTRGVTCRRSRGAVTVREAAASAWTARPTAVDAPPGPAPDLIIVTTESHHT
jgi:hypothetical protein